MATLVCADQNNFQVYLSWVKYSLVLHLRLLFLSMWTLELYNGQSREAFDILKT